MKIELVETKGVLGDIDTLTAKDVFIERLNKHCYFVQLGERVFHFRNLSGKGPGIEFRDAGKKGACADTA